MFYYIFKLLPLKIEFKNLGSKFNPQEMIAIGFNHEIHKNTYLIKAIMEEFELSKNSKILSGKSIVEEIELIEFIVDYS